MSRWRGFYVFSLYKLLQHINTHASSSVQRGTEALFLSLLSSILPAEWPNHLWQARSSVQPYYTVCACVRACVCWTRLSVMLGRSPCTKEQGHRGASPIAQAAAAVCSCCSTCWRCGCRCRWVCLFLMELLFTVFQSSLKLYTLFI